MPELQEVSKMAAEDIPVDSPMEAKVKKLAEKVWKKYQALDESQRYLIGIAGIPGSGKSTFATSLGYHLNKLAQTDRHQKYPNAPDYHLSRPRTNANDTSRQRNFSDPCCPDVAHVLPMDGYHLTRAQLSAMQNPEEAHFRRGAAFTFDADAYLALIEKLKQPIEPGSRTIWAPSFDHATKDPVENDIAIARSSRIIIVEGLYTALCYPPAKTASSTNETKADIPSAWSEACGLMDEIWLISVPIPTATERVAKRNFKAGLSPTLEAAFDRTMKNDMKNAQEILENLPPPDKLTEKIESVEDQGWKTQEQEMELEAAARKKQEEQAVQLRRMGLERQGSIAEMVEAGAGM